MKKRTRMRTRSRKRGVLRPEASGAVSGAERARGGGRGKEERGLEGRGMEGRGMEGRGMEGRGEREGVSEGRRSEGMRMDGEGGGKGKEGSEHAGIELFTSGGEQMNVVAGGYS